MAKFVSCPTFGDRYPDAIQFACVCHLHQVRKQTVVPYISHLLAVSALIWEAGGDEDDAIAALLHDTIEDAGVLIVEIELRFSHKVACLVWDCTDPGKRSGQDPPHGYEPGCGMRVRIADALHNARCCFVDRDRLPEDFVLRQIEKYEQLLRMAIAIEQTKTDFVVARLQSWLQLAVQQLTQASPG